MRAASSDASKSVAALLIVAGLIVAIAAWVLPANLTSISPALLHEAGINTPSVAAFGRQLIESEKPGPAELVLAAARSVRDPAALSLEKSLTTFKSQQPGMAAWGGWDPFLDPLFKMHETPGGVGQSTPVLTLFLPQEARATLLNYLQGSRSLGVQSLLQLRSLDHTGRFVPATQAGGQPLDAVILLTAVLYQGEHLSPALQREVRSMSDVAREEKRLGDLEFFFMDVLSLGRRLDWVQLSEFLRRTDSTRTVGEFAHLARVAPDELPLIYTAALFSDSADRVASYLIRYGKSGLADLRLALGDGQGAVSQLLLRQVPVNRSPSGGIEALAGLVLMHPRLMLGVKYLGYLLGVFLLLRGLDNWIVAPAGAGGKVLHMKSGALAMLFSALLIVASEPFLLKAAPPSEFRQRFVLPVLVATSQPPAPPNSKTATKMDTSTLLSIGLFASLQVAMYLFCLTKIREISRSSVSPLVKLRLMENEENLFDGGLYVGIGGTATALVLQVLGIIEPNLLAAYSSNLFGITCVALVKIRSVRPYKRKLILESQAVTPTFVQPTLPSGNPGGAPVIT
jgi:hypothetical protein